jgi:hypothetical protein
MIFSSSSEKKPYIFGSNPIKMVVYALTVNVVAASFEKWRAIESGGTFPSAGGPFCSGTAQERLNADAMAGSRRISPGLISMPGSPIVSSM